MFENFYQSKSNVNDGSSTERVLAAAREALGQERTQSAAGVARTRASG